MQGSTRTNATTGSCLKEHRVSTTISRLGNILGDETEHSAR